MLPPFGEIWFLDNRFASISLFRHGAAHALRCANLVSLNIECNRLQHWFFTYPLTMVMVKLEHFNGIYLLKLTTLTTSRISDLEMCHLVGMRRKIKHVRMTDRRQDEWHGSRIKLFKFIGSSDDKNAESSVEVTADLSASSNAEGDGVLGNGSMTTTSEFANSFLC